MIHCSHQDIAWEWNRLFYFRNFKICWCSTKLKLQIAKRFASKIKWDWICISTNLITNFKLQSGSHIAHCVAGSYFHFDKFKSSARIFCFWFVSFLDQGQLPPLNCKLQTCFFISLQNGICLMVLVGRVEIKKTVQY